MPSYQCTFVQDVSDLQRLVLDSPSDPEIRIAAYRGLVLCLPHNHRVLEAIHRALDAQNVAYSPQGNSARIEGVTTLTLGSCLKAGQHFIFVIIYLLLPINCIILDSVSKILFNFLWPIIIIIMILIMKTLLHNEYKIINLWYPTYVYQFFNFSYNNKNRVLACFQTRPQHSYPKVINKQDAERKYALSR